MIIASTRSVRIHLHGKLKLPGTGVTKPELGNQEMLAERMIKAGKPKGIGYGGRIDPEWVEKELRNRQ